MTKQHFFQILWYQLIMLMCILSSISSISFFLLFTELQGEETTLQTMEDYITRNNMGTYWCKGCGQHACSRKDLTRHIEAKHLNNIYNCKYCGFTINTRYGLQRHLNKQHKQPGMSINEIMKWHTE